MLALLGQFKFYIMGVLLALLLAVSTWSYIQGVRIDRLKADNKAYSVALKTSNTSLEETIKVLNSTTKVLKDKSAQEMAAQEQLKKDLVALQKKDVLLKDLATRLRNNKTGVCAVPEDIRDAWNTL